MDPKSARNMYSNIALTNKHTAKLHLVGSFYVSPDIFASTNKIHREVGRAKDLSAPLYIEGFKQILCFVLKSVICTHIFDTSIRCVEFAGDSLNDAKHTADRRTVQLQCSLHIGC